MLKKLIKHEFKDTMRLFIPMFGFIVVLTPIFSLMMSLGSQPYNENTADALSLVFGSGIIGYCLLLFGLLIVTQVLIAIRFYKTMTSQEAYLTFTLPAKTGQLLFAKWLVSFVWYILACGIALISILIVVLIATPITLSEIIHGIGFVLQTINLSDFTGDFYVNQPLVFNFNDVSFHHDWTISTDTPHRIKHWRLSWTFSGITDCYFVISNPICPDIP